MLECVKKAFSWFVGAVSRFRVQSSMEARDGGSQPAAEPCRANLDGLERQKAESGKFTNIHEALDTLPNVMKALAKLRNQQRDMYDLLARLGAPTFGKNQAMFRMSMEPGFFKDGPMLRGMFFGDKFKKGDQAGRAIGGFLMREAILRMKWDEKG